MRACRGRRLNNLTSRYKMSAPTSEGLRLFIEQGMIESGGPNNTRRLSAVNILTVTALKMPF